MPLVHEVSEVREIYAEVEEKGACLPAFGTENSRCTEAILRAATDVGERYRLKAPPIIIAFTANYAPRPQLRNYTASGRAEVGLLALLGDVEALLSDDSPYRHVRVMLHLDHAHPCDDARIIQAGLDKYATVMYDCSHLSLDENIRLTARYVEESRGSVLVEGAVDEIYEADGGAIKNKPTAAEDAERYVRETGAFLIVPNLGTEHRATAQEIRYQRARAREIKALVGNRLVLHGTSSLKEEDLQGLKDDGVIKVNIWTILEVTGGQAVTRNVITQLGNLLGREELTSLRDQGFLGERYFTTEYLEKVDGRLGPKLSAIPEAIRRDIWVSSASDRMQRYCDAFGYANLA